MSRLGWGSTWCNPPWGEARCRSIAEDRSRSEVAPSTRKSPIWCRRRPRLLFVGHDQRPVGPPSQDHRRSDRFDRRGRRRRGPDARRGAALGSRAGHPVPLLQFEGKPAGRRAGGLAEAADPPDPGRRRPGRQRPATRGIGLSAACPARVQSQPRDDRTDAADDAVHRSRGEVGDRPDGAHQRRAVQPAAGRRCARTDSEGQLRPQRRAERGARRIACAAADVGRIAGPRRVGGPCPAGGGQR